MRHIDTPMARCEASYSSSPRFAGELVRSLALRHFFYRKISGNTLFGRIWIISPTGSFKTNDRKSIQAMREFYVYKKRGKVSFSPFRSNPFKRD